MQLLRVTFFIVASIAVILNHYIYFYPIFRGCGFPTKTSLSSNRSVYPWATLNGQLQKFHTASDNAEFRLLVFGDPQLEGDTSIWHPHKDALYRPQVLIKRLQEVKKTGDRLRLVKDAVRDGITRALPNQLAAWRKQIDLIGNDYYLAHIYRTLYAYTKPTHVSVVGDLLGSQWITDEEFSKRASRFWNRVFRHGIRVDDENIAQQGEQVIGEDPLWSRRIINIAGNHDIGYAGDITVERLSRFERAFGKANWDIVLRSRHLDEETQKHPSLRLIILNSMILDTPAKSPDLQTETYDFINDVIQRSKPVEDRTVGTILLTHIPLYKEEGICVDGPFFDFYQADSENGLGLKEQNHLSYEAGLGILEGIFGMSSNADAPGSGLGRNGIILNGHDHEGCDVYHYLPRESHLEGEPLPSVPRWNATRYETPLWQMASPIPGLREVTLRSMMGEFGGYAYMLSAWFDKKEGKWQFEVNRCGAGVQHFWWAAHILLLVSLGLGSAVLVEGMLRIQGSRSSKAIKTEENTHREQKVTKVKKVKVHKRTPVRDKCSR